MLSAAVDSALPARCVPANLPSPPRGRTIVVGAGKAAAAMAQAVEDHWPTPVYGVVVTRYGHTTPCRSISVLEAGHPIPDQAGVEAARTLLDTVAGLGPDDLVLCLISGGGSALLPALPPGVSLDDERALARALINSGASISEMNCVRKHVSLIKGGQLAAAAAPARVVTLVISDVPGDDPSTIASGPTVPDPTTRHDALAIIERRGIAVPPSILAWLGSAASETPKPQPGSELDCRLIATPQLALEAAATVAREAGFQPLILGNAIEGEARDVGLVHAAIARQVLDHAQPAKAPCVILSGGETTVTVRGTGRGGRNVEFLLSLLIGLGEHEEIAAIAADTDGIDGTEDNAGAIISQGTLDRARQLGLSAKDFLMRNDAYSFFRATGDLVTTGATLTNVNDFRAILIGAPLSLEPEAR
jgi:hydroxypyruvate reductase